MIIDLDLFEDYTIDKDIIIPENYYKDSEVEKLENIHVKGKLFHDSDDSIHVNIQIEGKMILLDSISLEKVEYPFSIKYDDKLDLFEFLWENIVLEIPLKFTKVEDLSKFHGDGWKLISEEEQDSSNNPFNDLLKNFDKKE